MFVVCFFYFFYFLFFFLYLYFFCVCVFIIFFDIPVYFFSNQNVQFHYTQKQKFIISMYMYVLQQINRIFSFAGGVGCLTQAVEQSYAVGFSARENLFLLSRRRGGPELLEAGALLCRTRESYFRLRSGRSHQQSSVHAQGLICGETAAFQSLSALSGFCELSSR